MEFNPNNNIVKLCLQGMEMRAKGNSEEASKLFLQAWKESTNDFEKFTAAYYVAQYQKNVSEKLKWLETSLQYASKINDNTVQSAFPFLYSNIDKCYEEMALPEKAKKNYDLAPSFSYKQSDIAPFYHGTKADV